MNKHWQNNHQILILIIYFSYSCSSPSNQSCEKLKSGIGDTTIDLSYIQNQSSYQRKTSSKYHSLEQNFAKNPDSTHIKTYQIFPTDESHQDAALVVFVEKLQKCVQKKDTSVLFSMRDSGIVVSWGGSIFGKKLFAETWNLELPKTSQVWDAMNEVIKLGGTFEEDGEGKYFQFPSVHSNKLLQDIPYDDPYHTCISITPKTKVLDKPNNNAKLLAYLNYEVVSIDIEFYHKNQEFLKIETFDNKIKGFAKSSDFISLASNKLILRKNKKGNWKIVSFAPFD